jgi:hypothetical protein
MSRRLLTVPLLLLAAIPARAANLDVSAAYKMKAVSYENLNLTGDKPARNNRSFISNDARLGVAVRRIELETRRGEMMTMDVGIALRALGATGTATSSSTARSTVQSAPFQQIGANYPSADFTPFLEQAYVRVNNFLGYPLVATIGRQNYRLGSGLLLDDDGAGLTGVTMRGDLPWWGMKAEGFVFSDRDARQSVQDAPDNSLALFGFAVDLPGEGVWQLNQLFERSRGNQQIYGCTYPDAGVAAPWACYASKTLKSFTSLRYSLNYGPIVFDGEAAFQKGIATPIGNPYDAAGSPPPGRITYNANAQVVKGKWKQALPRFGEGIARMSVARGSGDDGGTPTKDEAFYPAHGHQFDGLDRSGFGAFYNATPYSAFGGNYGSTTTASGLQEGSSGIVVVGAGYTPPAYKGFILDVDFYLFQTERAVRGNHTLGTEWDLRLRYNVQDRFGISVSAAFFKSGKSTSANGASAKKYALEAFGRF